MAVALERVLAGVGEPGSPTELIPSVPKFRVSRRMAAALYLTFAGLAIAGTLGWLYYQPLLVVRPLKRPPM